jgi:hypothetical protein
MLVLARISVGSTRVPPSLVRQGKRQAGAHGSASDGSAPVATPNSWGTGTAKTASNGASSAGTSTADTESDGLSTVDSGNNGTGQETADTASGGNSTTGESHKP